MNDYEYNKRRREAFQKVGESLCKADVLECIDETAIDLVDMVLMEMGLQCKEDECFGKTRANGLCQKHYSKKRHTEMKRALKIVREMEL